MKDFTLYPEALALKELGFNEKCFGHHNNHEPKRGPRGLVIRGYQDHNEETEGDDLICSAPTYSQAFRFFREKYNLHVNKTGNANYTSFNMTEPKMEVLSFVRYTDTKNHYEEAELACLRKLIEICCKLK